MLSSRPTVLGYAAVVGKKEGEGPLGRVFDAVFDDTTMGEKTWEKAESAFQKRSVYPCAQQSGLFAVPGQFPVCRRSAQSEYRLHLRPPGDERPLPGSSAPAHHGADPAWPLFLWTAAQPMCAAPSPRPIFVRQNASPATRWNMGDSVRRPRSDRQCRRFAVVGMGGTARISNGLHWAGHRSRRDR